MQAAGPPFKKQFRFVFPGPHFLLVRSRPLRGGNTQKNWDKKTVISGEAENHWGDRQKGYA